jgi:hypothetical protein
MGAPFGLFAQFDETPRVEQGIGVAFETARIPGEIDEEPIQDLPGIGPGGLLGDPGPSDGQVGAITLGQVGCDIGAIAVEEIAVVADRLAGFRRRRRPARRPRARGISGISPRVLRRP